MNTTLIALVMTTAKSDVQNAGLPDDIEGIVKACMKSARDHFMVTDEQQQLVGALEAAYALAGDEDKERIKTSTDALAKMNAMLNAAQVGVAVDFESVIPAKETAAQILPLMKWWHETGDRGAQL